MMACALWVSKLGKRISSAAAAAAYLAILVD
jgi:hypothetical protein